MEGAKRRGGRSNLRARWQFGRAVAVAVALLATTSFPSACADDAAVASQPVGGTGGATGAGSGGRGDATDTGGGAGGAGTDGTDGTISAETTPSPCTLCRKAENCCKAAGLADCGYTAACTSASAGEQSAFYLPLCQAALDSSTSGLPSRSGACR